MPNHGKHERGAVTLLEVIAAITIAAIVAALSLYHLRKPGDTANQRSCDLTRKVLQEDTHRYFDETGNMPSADLRELRDPDYTGDVLPTCPLTSESYGLDKNDTVACPTHEATRVK